MGLGCNFTPFDTCYFLTFSKRKPSEVYGAVQVEIRDVPKLKLELLCDKKKNDAKTLTGQFAFSYSINFIGEELAPKETVTFGIKRPLKSGIRSVIKDVELPIEKRGNLCMIWCLEALEGTLSHDVGILAFEFFPGK